MTIRQKLRTIMKVGGLTQVSLAERLGVAQSTVNRWLVNAEPEGHRRDAITALYNEILGIPNSELPSTLRMVSVAANVQAGAWSESWEWPEEDQYQVAVPNDEHLRPYRLYAAETRGPSMNRRWPEGTVVVFTNAAETMESPVVGKRYIVERRRAGEAEHTVKLLHKDENGQFWLIPESTDPLHQQPIPVEDGDKEEDHVVILGRIWYAVTRE